MDFYGWKTKIWRFNSKNCEEKRKQMLAWKEKYKNKYQMREVFVNNAWSLEYRLLLVQ